MAAYLDDVVTFDSDPTADVKLSPSKAGLGATDAEVLSHSILLEGVRPNPKTMSVLIKIPKPRNRKPVRALMGGVGYYRNACATCLSGSFLS